MPYPTILFLLSVAYHLYRWYYQWTSYSQLVDQIRELVSKLGRQQRVLQTTNQSVEEKKNLIGTLEQSLEALKYRLDQVERKEYDISVMGVQMELLQLRNVELLARVNTQESTVGYLTQQLAKMQSANLKLLTRLATEPARNQRMGDMDQLRSQHQQIISREPTVVRESVEGEADIEVIDVRPVRQANMIDGVEGERIIQVCSVTVGNVTEEGTEEMVLIERVTEKADEEEGVGQEAITSRDINVEKIDEDGVAVGEVEGKGSTSSKDAIADAVVVGLDTGTTHGRQVLGSSPMFSGLNQRSLASPYCDVGDANLTSSSVVVVPGVYTRNNFWVESDRLKLKGGRSTSFMIHGLLI